MKERGEVRVERHPLLSSEGLPGSRKRSQEERGYEIALVALRSGRLRGEEHRRGPFLAAVERFGLRRALKSGFSWHAGQQDQVVPPLDR